MVSGIEIVKPKEYELVILCSGGIDSTLAYYYAIKEKGFKKEDILCLYVNLNHPYSWKELDGLRKSGIPFTVIDVNILREEFCNIPQPVHPYSIVLNRNVLLSVLAGMLGKRTWVCALEDEMHKQALERDKSPEFFHLMSGLLSYTSAIRRDETIVETPFKNMTKAELIRWALNNNIDKKIILSTHTCYDGDMERCGKCFVCFKRWISLTLNNLKENYNSNPWESEEAKRLIGVYKDAWNRQDFSHYHRKRVIECFNALTKKRVNFGLRWSTTKDWK